MNKSLYIVNTTAHFSHLVGYRTTHIQFSVTGLETENYRVYEKGRDKGMDGRIGSDESAEIAFQGIFNELPFSLPSPFTLNLLLPYD